MFCQDGRPGTSKLDAHVIRWDQSPLTSESHASHRAQAKATVHLVWFYLEISSTLLELVWKMFYFLLIILLCNFGVAWCDQLPHPLPEEDMNVVSRPVDTCILIDFDIFYSMLVGSHSKITPTAISYHSILVESGIPSQCCCKLLWPLSIYISALCLDRPQTSWRSWQELARSDLAISWWDLGRLLKLGIR